MSDSAKRRGRDILCWLQGSQIEQSADYIRRGRRHAALSTEALFASWKEMFLAMAGDPFSDQLLAAETDLAAEIELRELTVPYDEVEEAMQRFIAAVDAQVLLMRWKDPDRYAGANQSLHEEVSDFSAKMRQSNN